MQNEVTFGVVQHETLYGDIEGNIRRALDMVDDAVSRGSEIVCLSYYWFVGHSDGIRSPSLEEKIAKLRNKVQNGEIRSEQMHRQILLDFAQPIPDGMAWSLVADKAREHGIYIIAGSGPERQGDSIYHSVAVFDDKGNLVGKHRKSILWDREAIYVTPGNDWEVFDLGLCKIATPICSEGQYVPEITRLLALKGAEVLVVPNGVHLPREMLFAIPVTRAIETQSYYVMIGQSPIGFRFPQIPRYTSCIVSPIRHLNPVLATGQEGPSLLVETLDIGRIRKERELKAPIIGDYSVHNAVNDMVLGEYSYPMLTQHLLNSDRGPELLEKYYNQMSNSMRRSETISV